MSTPLVVVGRQPIFDRGLDVLGYELLFRAAGVPALSGARPDGHQMTADVLFSSISIGIDRLVGGRKLFCNATREVLTGDLTVVLPPERTVIEILESVVPDEEVLEGCRRLRDEGYAFALDDFVWTEHSEELLKLASYVKFDMKIEQADSLPVLVERCRQFDVALVAEKVETEDELTYCSDLGFDFFQGYFLSKPRQVVGRALDVGKIAKLQLAARLANFECSLSELEEVIRTDPAMTHQLLQLAGAGANRGMRREVNSIREAIVLLGWRRLQSWASLVLIADKGRGWEEGITNALIRARTCELASQTLGPEMSDAAFTAGMISSFDTLLGTSREEIVESLPLSDELRHAVLDGSGALGQLLSDTTDYLQGHPELATRSTVGEDRFSDAAFQALTWAVELSQPAWV